MKLPKNSEEMAEYQNKNIYSGKSVLKEICLFSGSLTFSPFICFLIAFLRMPIPYLVRYYEHKSAFYLFSRWDSWLYSVLESLLGTFIVALNFLFVLAGLIDF